MGCETYWELSLNLSLLAHFTVDHNRKRTKQRLQVILCMKIMHNGLYNSFCGASRSIDLTINLSITTISQHLHPKMRDYRDTHIQQISRNLMTRVANLILVVWDIISNMHRSKTRSNMGHNFGTFVMSTWGSWIFVNFSIVDGVVLVKTSSFHVEGSQSIPIESLD